MPQPSSLTSIHASPAVASSRTRTAPPGGLCLMAFTTRLSTARRRRAASAHSRGHGDVASRSRLTPRASATVVVASTAATTTSWRSTAPSRSDNVPWAMRARSTMSSMIRAWSATLRSMACRAWARWPGSSRSFRSAASAARGRPSRRSRPWPGWRPRRRRAPPARAPARGRARRRRAGGRRRARWRVRHRPQGLVRERGDENGRAGDAVADRRRGTPPQPITRAGRGRRRSRYDRAPCGR